jgi:hypothetical protein
LRRAVALAEGWAPFGLSIRDLSAMIGTARETAAWAARPLPLEVVLQNSRPADPGADPEGTRQIVSRLVEAGATALQLRLIHHSVAHYTEQMEAMLTALA